MGPRSAEVSQVQTATATTPPAPVGYWMVGADGSVYSLGGVPFRGSLGGMRLSAPVVTMRATPDQGGYWVVAQDGGIFAFGDAPFAGSTGAMRLNRPIVGMAATPSGRGYWLVASDGGIFAFGDAGFYGSTGAMHLNRPIVGMAVTPSGHGYWLVASDGGIFAFGDAGFYGSTGAMRLNLPIITMAATPDGGGYWLVASDGGVFSFGSAAFHGSTGAMRLNRPISAMAASPSGQGYWLAASDGGVFTFGDATYRGSLGSAHLAAPIVGMVPGTSLDPYLPLSNGFDISWPQCGGSYPGAHDFAIIGANDGTAMTTNPCFASEWDWSGTGSSVYLNANSPQSGSLTAQSGPAGPCAPTDSTCLAYNWGYNSAAWTANNVLNQGAVPMVWWLDIEVGTWWSSDQNANTTVIRGMTDALQAKGLTVGVYSTPYQWGVITGGAMLGLPTWEAGAPASDPTSYCGASKAFNGGKAWLAQYQSDPSVDRDQACP